jgi:protein-S-isoprenylcysteine O-methyltransferase Ste14
LASVGVKRAASKILGGYMAFYRLGYNIFSMLLLLAVYEISPKPPVIIYDLPVPYDLIIFGLQLLSLAAAVYVFSLFDFKEFLGINQIIRWHAGTYDGVSDEISEFRVTKIYKYMRHPGYFFTILFMGFRPQMDVFYFTAFICFSSYFYVGSFFEDKKLEALFGKPYSDYKNSVPGFLPFKLFGK